MCFMFGLKSEKFISRVASVSQISCFCCVKEAFEVVSCKVILNKDKDHNVSPEIFYIN